MIHEWFTGKTKGRMLVLSLFSKRIINLYTKFNVALQFAVAISIYSFKSLYNPAFHIGIPIPSCIKSNSNDPYLYYNLKYKHTPCLKCQSDITKLYYNLHLIRKNNPITNKGSNGSLFRLIYFDISNNHATFNLIL